MPASKTSTVKRPRAARAASSSEASSASNGLEGFALHIDDRSKKKVSAMRKVRESAAAPQARNRNAGLLPTRELDPETAARNYLDNALAGQMPAARESAARAMKREFGSLGTEAVPLTGTRIVKFRQTFNKIPVYGSYVTVELDGDNHCIGINTSMGMPAGAARVAKIAPARAIAVAAKAASRTAASITSPPRLHYYFDQDNGEWKLAYIVEDVQTGERGMRGAKARDALRKDYVVDATKGTLLAALPRTPTATVSARDGRGIMREITVEKNGTHAVLRDAALNVVTYDFAFKDPSLQSQLLPGTLVETPPAPWPPAAIAAHANAEDVARFLRDVVKRNNIDNRGGALVSSIDCWDRADGTGVEREWPNAFWDGSQMVYGQIRYPDGSLYSVANMPDIVAHEMFHGVTDFTSRLEYRTQAGALNESYSDIFGVIVNNWGKPLADWDWQLGRGFDGPRTALRNLRNPALHGQPKHMRDFKNATPPYTYERNDYGHVHGNSGIHNYAAYRVMTAKSAGKFVFTPDEIAAMFFIALTLQLSRTSQFTDSRRAMVQAARTLFRNEAEAKREVKVKAVEKGFSAAGVT